MIIIKNIKLEQDNSFNTLSADFSFNISNADFVCAKTCRVWFSTKEEINNCTDVFLVPCIVPAMKKSSHINYPGAVSHKLYNGIYKAQEILSGWYSDLNAIDLCGGIKDDLPVRNNGDVACFFSGGVDSFYTLLKHSDEISKIVYVRGFDVGLLEREYLDMMSIKIAEMAKALGKELIEVETNIHLFGDEFADWSFQYHGSALASVALLLSNKINKIYIPSSYQRKDVFPWGTHPELDNLWSNELVEIIHDDCQPSRTDKIKYIIDNPVALKYLRVCTDRTKGLYNCCECEKCLRTIISIYAFGAFDKCNTFPKLDRTLIEAIKFDNHSIIFAEENYSILPSGQLKSALKSAMDIFKSH